MPSLSVLVIFIVGAVLGNGVEGYYMKNEVSLLGMH